MIWPQIWFNPRAWLPQVPQWKWTKPTAQMGTKQPSVSPNMTAMDAAPMTSMDAAPIMPMTSMTPMSPVDQRIAGLQDRMSMMPRTQMPQADASAFSLDQIFGKWQSMKPQIWVDFGTGLPSGQQVTEQMPQVRGWIKEKAAETGIMTRSEFATIIQPVKDMEQREQILDAMLEMWFKIEWLNYEPEQAPTMFDTARERVTDILWEEGTQGINVAWIRIDPTQPMRTAAMAGVDVAEWISEAYNRRQKKLDEIIKAQAIEEQWATRSTLQWLWQAMWLGGDVVWEWFMAWLKVLDQAMWWAGSALLSKIWETEAARQWLVMLWEWLEKYNEFAEQNPALARDIDALLWAADFMLNFVWVGLTGKWVQQARTATRARDIQKIVNRTPLAPAQEIAQIAKTIDPNVSFIDKAISQIAKIDPQTAKTLRTNKWLIVYGDAQWWTNDIVAQGVLDTLETNIGRFGEAGQAYRAIRESWQQVNMQPIKSRIIQELEKDWIKVVNNELVFPTWLKKYDNSDQRLIKEAIEVFLKEWDITTADNFLDGRLLLSKQAAFDRNVTKSQEAVDYIKRLRWAINDEAKKQISWLAQADNVYVWINENIDTLLREFFKDGVQKWNTQTKIKQIMNRLDSDPQKQALLRLVPDIDDKLKYLAITDDLVKSQWNKVATYMASTLPIGWFIAGWPIWWVLWFLASTYFAWWEALKKLLLRFGSWWEDVAKRIANKVAKQQKLLDNEQKIIQEAIQEASQAAQRNIEIQRIKQLNDDLLNLEATSARAIREWEQAAKRQFLQEQYDIATQIWTKVEWKDVFLGAKPWDITPRWVIEDTIISGTRYRVKIDWEIIDFSDVAGKIYRLPEWQAPVFTNDISDFVSNIQRTTPEVTDRQVEIPWIDNFQTRTYSNAMELFEWLWINTAGKRPSQILNELPMEVRQEAAQYIRSASSKVDEWIQTLWGRSLDPTNIDDIVPPARTSNMDIRQPSAMLKASDDLILEARKYKSADEFAENILKRNLSDNEKEILMKMIKKNKINTWKWIYKAYFDQLRKIRKEANK
jgi:transcriptional regulator